MQLYFAALSVATDPTRLSRTRTAILLLSFLLVWFAGIDDRALTRPDEGRYSEIPREMAVTGDWVTPRLNGLKYFEKPPLQYWATALAYNVLGEHNWTARLWPVLTGLFGLAIVFGITRRLYGLDAGIAAAAALGSSLWYFAIAHFNTLDMGLTCWMTLALSGFLFAQRADATRNERFAGMHVAWVGMALAVLSKGLIGIVLPGGVLFLYSLWQRDLKLWDRLHIGSGLLLFFAIVTPWFVWVQSRNPGFSDFFFFHEHFARFSSTTHRREGGWWYFIPILIGGFAPWTGPMAFQLRALGVALATPKPFHPERLLVVWVAFIFAFFSASGSKLPSYVLPVFPAMAILFGSRIGDLGPRAWLTNALVGMLFAIACVVALLNSDRFASDEVPRELFVHMWPWLFAGVISLFAGVWWALRLSWRGRALGPVLATAAGCMLCWLFATYGHNALSPASSSYHLVRQIESTHGPFDPKIPFFTIRTYEQTLPFYLKRTMTLVDFYDEMALGLLEEPSKGIPHLAEFLPRWSALEAGYATMKPETYDELRAAGVPMRELGHDTRRVIVSRK